MGARPTGVNMKDKKKFIEGAKSIIKKGDCASVGCVLCPFYFVHNHIDCMPVLGRFVDNPYKVDWFKQWLSEQEAVQLEFSF